MSTKPTTNFNGQIVKTKLTQDQERCNLLALENRRLRDRICLMVNAGVEAGTVRREARVLFADTLAACVSMGMVFADAHERANAVHEAYVEKFSPVVKTDDEAEETKAEGSTEGNAGAGG